MKQGRLITDKKYASQLPPTKVGGL